METRARGQLGTGSVRVPCGVFSAEAVHGGNASQVWGGTPFGEEIGGKSESKKSFPEAVVRERMRNGCLLMWLLILHALLCVICKSSWGSTFKDD